MAEQAVTVGFRWKGGGNWQGCRRCRRADPLGRSACHTRGLEMLLAAMLIPPYSGGVGCPILALWAWGEKPVGAVAPHVVLHAAAVTAGVATAVLGCGLQGKGSW